jgi:hypothetical protein
VTSYVNLDLFLFTGNIQEEIKYKFKKKSNQTRFNNLLTEYQVFKNSKFKKINKKYQINSNFEKKLKKKIQLKFIIYIFLSNYMIKLIIFVDFYCA